MGLARNQPLARILATRHKEPPARPTAIAACASLSTLLAVQIAEDCDGVIALEARRLVIAHP